MRSRSGWCGSPATSEAELQRGHEPIAIDEAEQVGEPQPEAGARAHALAIAAQQPVHHVAHGLAKHRAIERVPDRRRRAGDDALVPRVAARGVEQVGDERRERHLREHAAHAAEQLAGRAGADLGHKPARDRRRERVDVRARDARGARGEQRGQIEPSDFFRDIGLREDAIAHHRAHAPGQELPVPRNERGVRDRQPERMSKQRRDREPVGQPADNTGFTDREEQPAPPRLAERKRGDGQHHGCEQTDQRHRPLHRAIQATSGAREAEPGRA